MAMEIENPFISNAFGRFSAGFESPLSHQRGVLMGLPFELFVNIFRKLHVGVQLFSVLKLWIEGFFPYYNIWRFL